MAAHDIYNIKALFDSLANADENAFRAIFDLYKKRIFSLALKMLKSETEAEEIVQDVFLSVWLAKEKLGSINDPEAYLFTITYNTISAHLKKISRNRKLLNTLLHHLTEIQNTTEETVAAHETGKLVRQATDELPARQRNVFQLSKQEGLSYDEIAEHMHISRNTVRNHLAEAMKTIRTFLKETAMLFMSLVVFLSK